MLRPLLPAPMSATGVIDPIGTAIVLLVTVLGAYAARQSWLQYQQDVRLRWVIAGGLGVSLAVLGTVSLLLDLAAVLGLLQTDRRGRSYFLVGGIGFGMPSTVCGASFGRRVGATLLAGIPGVLALVGQIYLTTSPAAVPAGLSSPLFAVLSGINPLLLLSVACLLGAYTAPRVGLQSYLLDRVATDEAVRPQLRTDVGLAVGFGVLGAVSIVVLDTVLAPFVAQDLPRSVIGGGRPTVVDVLAYAPVRFLYGGITEELMLRFGLMSALVFGGWYVTGRSGEGPGPGVVWAAIVSGVVYVAFP